MSNIKVEILYTVTKTVANGGKRERGPEQIWEYEVSGPEAKLYKEALEAKRSFREYPELMDVLKKAEKEIHRAEMEKFLDSPKENFVFLSFSIGVMEPSYITYFVHNHTEQMLKYFELQGLSEEEIAAWDAEQDLEEMPTWPAYCKEEAEILDPFDRGYYMLDVHFAGDPAHKEAVPVRDVP